MHAGLRSVLGVAALAGAVAIALAGCSATVSGAGVGHAAPVRPPASPASTAAQTLAPAAPPVTAPEPPAVPAVVRRKAVNHCAHNAGGKLVLVSVARQHVWMCAGHRTVFATPVTTGAVALAYDATPVGNFRIQGRDRNTTLTLNTGQTYQVRYWIPFNAPLFGFHDASWQHFPYGSPRYRTHGSHGCVHMPLPAMRFLYRWGTIGTPVHIRG